MKEKAGMNWITSMKLLCEESKILINVKKNCLGVAKYPHKKYK
ncbi:hypothetical protein FJSC11DRAFT_1255 [Fischerella thermalis JSC-11]|jgi:hypothetical protein|uniref:Uncharacterized protein n=1 Tax=Fischerella thermalis JSC-11 TaxID=741277 RepID=G6FQV8_9CYAN|nr:hypothetical protein FJSC11DRAFT_1255 [Fischerella thermalis JSC-11]